MGLFTLEITRTQAKGLSLPIVPKFLHWVPCSGLVNKTYRVNLHGANYKQCVAILIASNLLKLTIFVLFNFKRDKLYFQLDVVSTVYGQGAICINGIIRRVIRGRHFSFCGWQFTTGTYRHPWKGVPRAFSLCSRKMSPVKELLYLGSQAGDLRHGVSHAIGHCHKRETQGNWGGVNLLSSIMRQLPENAFCLLDSH